MAAVITEAGNDPSVRGLVYVAAFAPDAGESVQTLIQNPPPGAPVPPIVPMGNDYLLVDPAKFHAAFAADLAADKAAFMADAQVPWGIAALRARSVRRHGATNPAGTSSARRTE